MTRAGFLKLAIGLIAVDLTLTFALLASGILDSGRAPILDVWDLSKALAAASLLFAGGKRHRSNGLRTFGGVFLAVAAMDSTTLHALLARPVNDVLRFDRMFGVHPLDAIGIAEAFTLTIFAVVGVTLIIVVRDSWWGYRLARHNLLVLLGLLVLFATGFDLVDALTGVQGRWSLVEEMGERVVMSCCAAYAASLWVDPVEDHPKEPLTS